MSLGILTPGLVHEAFELVRPQIEATLKSRAKREHLAIVVTAPEAINPRNPDKSFKDDCYLVTGIGDKDDWEHDYEAVALSKADESARTGKGTAKLAPHYLLDEDTVYWGSVVIEDIVVACSGAEAYFDEMFSGWIATAIKALCKEKFAKLPTGTEFIE
jgi:hypothetical protein